MVNLSKKQFIIVAGGVIVAGILVAFVMSGLRTGGGIAPVSLKVWGTDPASVWKGIIDAYQKLRPNAKVEYTELDPGNYKKTLLNALAAGTGPDVFYIGNRELLEEKDKIVEVDARQFNLLRLRELYPTAVEQDFVLGGRIFALPLYMDTMALLYNRDLFDQAGVAVPPKTWEEFLRIVPQLRQIDAGGKITRAAAAIGGSEKSVDAGVDLLNLLMLQNGAQMTKTDERGITTAVFASGESGTTGYRAFDFYIQFANPASTYFTWDDNQPNSLAAFADGKVAMVFNYLSALPGIKRISPFLNIRISAMPQPQGAKKEINYARYHGLVVSRQSRVAAWAWDLIIFATADEAAARLYADGTGRLPALLPLIAEKVGDVNLGVFAKQALTARSWLQPSGDGVRDTMSRAIESVLAGQVDAAKALRQAEGQINQLYPKQ